MGHRQVFLYEMSLSRILPFVKLKHMILRFAVSSSSRRLARLWSRDKDFVFASRFWHLAQAAALSSLSKYLTEDSLNFSARTRQSKKPFMESKGILCLEGMQKRVTKRETIPYKDWATAESPRIYTELGRVRFRGVSCLDSGCLKMVRPLANLGGGVHNAVNHMFAVLWYLVIVSW